MLLEEGDEDEDEDTSQFYTYRLDVDGGQDEEEGKDGG